MTSTTGDFAAVDPRTNEQGAHAAIDRADVIEIARRGAVGLALASIAGLAMGAREGVLSMAVHAAGIPLALLAVVALGVPSLFVLLALADAPLDPRSTAAAAARGIGASGLVLAGLAPAIALFVVTSESTDAAALTTRAGLALAGVVGLGHVLREIVRALGDADLRTRAIAIGGLAGFAVFATALATRVWGALLPVLLGGAS
ncbi:hypothetical protein [Sandaracinus amylolyticus]|uniref:Yip1 domain-containing protein n=1 Tax=Sandaracinus amylolyticus TaxID=927083 RepID=A0A0F6W376_9BACT|nr:hypothetical protein [Sandaracinus amylolyticus]AKF06121.1 hypothetical protein DB32_003270 [Sandaracinus amylolyticus]